MAAKTIVGARAKIYVDNQLVGIFDSCSLSSSIGTEPIYTLGKYHAQEITVTSKEVCQVSCSGFRVLGQGKHTLPKMPTVGDLLNFEPFTITIVDRQSGVTLETVIGCVPTNDNTNYNAKATSKINISYVGILNFDEKGDQSDPGATEYPA